MPHACLTRCLTFFDQSRSLALSLLAYWLVFALNLAAFSQRFYDVLMEPSANLQHLNNCKLILIILLAPSTAYLAIDGARVQEWPR